MIKKYIKKPSVIEAVQFVDTSECLDEIKEFIGGDFLIHNDKKNPIIRIVFDNGDIVNAELGDFIVKDEFGSIFAKSEENFFKTHDVCD